MTRSLSAWLASGWVGVLLLPWYASGSAGPTTLLMHGLAGKPWLLPSVLWLAIASYAAWRGSSRLLAASASAGIVWLCLQALLIGHHGWSFAWLAWLSGSVGPVQPALGWGALAYSLALLMLFACGLTLRGWCKGDLFVTASIVLIVALTVVFVAYPLTCVLISAVRDEAGHFAPALFAEKLFSAGIWSLGCLVGNGRCGVAWNTVAEAALVGVLTTILGLAFALAFVRMRMPLKPLMHALSILPVITPPFVIALALMLLFGRVGIVTNFLAEHVGIPRSRWIYGMPGITIAQVLAFTPIAFLILVGVLQGVSPSLEEAAQTLHARPWRVFRTITWKLIRPGLANAFLIGFIESMADFGNPLLIGGNFNVLSTDIFFAVVGASHDQGRAAVLCLVLLVFTLAAFLLQRRWVGRRGYTTIAGKGDAGLPAPLPLGLQLACGTLILPWLVLTIAVYAIIMSGGFVESFGRDNTPTLRYFLTAFSVDHGVGGWFLSGSAWSSLITTTRIALLSMPVTAALGVLSAWLLNRQSFPGRTAFEFLTMMSFAIPGTVVGVSYILAFNVPPLELTGTAMILGIAFVFRNMPVGIRAGLSALVQIDRSLDEASLTLGARSVGTLRRVLLPLLRPAIVTAMTYSFVRAITAVSAVIFLVTGEYNLATVYIVGRADVGEYGIALVYSAVLILLMMSALLIMQMAVGRRRLGRRNEVSPSELTVSGAAAV